MYPPLFLHLLYVCNNADNLHFFCDIPAMDSILSSYYLAVIVQKKAAGCIPAALLKIQSVEIFAVGLVNLLDITEGLLLGTGEIAVSVIIHVNID